VICQVALLGIDRRSRFSVSVRTDPSGARCEWWGDSAAARLTYLFVEIDQALGIRFRRRRLNHGVLDKSAIFESSVEMMKGNTKRLLFDASFGAVISGKASTVVRIAVILRSTRPRHRRLLDSVRLLDVQFLMSQHLMTNVVGFYRFAIGYIE
jgi:hypothetical protein